jgi:hypothetical protein
MIGTGMPSFVVILVCALVLIVALTIAIIAVRALMRIAASLEARTPKD